MSQPQTVRIEPLDLIGRGRIADARRRLKQWDGETWAVTALPHPGSRMHVRPATTECVDWLGFWIETNDVHERVVQ